MDISGDTLVKRSDSLMSARLGDSEEGTVVLDKQTNAYFGMDGVAAYIWDQLDSPLALDELVQRIVGHYEVDPSKAQEDARVFVVRLIKKGLVDIAD